MLLIIYCFLIFMLTGIACLAIVFRKKYENLLRLGSDNRYLLKSLMPASLILLDCCKHGYKSKYDRALLLQLSELYSQRSSLQHLKLHYSNKLVLMFAGLVLAVIIGCFSKFDAEFLFFSLCLQGAIFYFADGELRNKVKKRRLQIRLDFPDFINKLTLLINAGMNIPRALEKISHDIVSDSPFYRELDVVLIDIASGKSEIKALEEFSHRCRTPEIMKFVSVILQNLRKGNSELVPILRLLSLECWELRKNTAKRLGEEASTKLLFPMMIMFIAILIIVVTPAILAMQSI